MYACFYKKFAACTCVGAELLHTMRIQHPWALPSNTYFDLEVLDQSEISPLGSIFLLLLLYIWLLPLFVLFCTFGLIWIPKELYY